MPRLLIVANRLPITVQIRDGEVEVERSSGGLATGLQRPHEQSDGLWIGWSGAPDELTPDQQASLDAKLAADRLVAVPLTAEQVTRYYEGYLQRGALAPLPLSPRPGPAPRQRLGRLRARPTSGSPMWWRRSTGSGDLIWVHDYQLLLLPGLLRRRLPDARIGFFLHIPFPVGGALPNACRPGPACSKGCSAPTSSAFTPPPTSVTSPPLSPTSWVSPSTSTGCQLPGREVRLGVFPMGIDAASFQQSRGRSRGRGRSPGAAGRRERADSRRGGPARLHQGHPPPAPRLRADAPDPSRAARAGAAGAGGGAVAHRGRGVPGVPHAGGRLVGRINGDLRHAALGCRSTTSSAGSRSPIWWRSTGRPT